MPTTSSIPGRNGLIVAAAVVSLFAVGGLLDLPGAAYSGLSSSRGRVVSSVADGSPAEQAGLEKGDVILEVNGVDTQDRWALLRRPPAEIGETRSYLVEREGREPFTVDVTFVALPTTNRLGLLGAALIGVAFLACGLGSYLTWPSRATALLGVLGLGAGLSFIPAPVFSHPEVRLLSALVVVVGFGLVPATLLHFVLRFPEPRRFGERALGYSLLYGPVIVVGLVVAITFWGTPSALGVAQVAAPGVPLIHVVAALGVLIHRYVKADRDERSAHGLNLLLIGLVASVAPPILGAFVSSLPGASYYFLSMILLPITLTLVVRRGERSAELQPQLT